MAARSRGNALDSVNAMFHEVYEGARAEEELDVPVFILLGDEFQVHRRGARRVLPATSLDAQVVKSAVHAPVAVFIALHAATESTLPAELVRRLARLGSMAETSLAGVTARGHELEPDVRAILELTIAFLDRVVASGHCSRAALTAFGASAGELARRLTDYATQLQLEALHRAVEQALAPLDSAERRSLQVVVTGDHQARSRSFAMQYFEARLGEPPGAEIRVTYAEDVESADDALRLVRTRRLDRAIAAAFFGDPRRMQRDLLGDAAMRILAKTKLEPIA